MFRMQIVAASLTYETCIRQRVPPSFDNKWIIKMYVKVRDTIIALHGLLLLLLFFVRWFTFLWSFDRHCWQTFCVRKLTKCTCFHFTFFRFVLLSYFSFKAQTHTHQRQLKKKWNWKMREKENVKERKKSAQIFFQPRNWKIAATECNKNMVKNGNYFVLTLCVRAVNRVLCVSQTAIKSAEPQEIDSFDGEKNKR